MKQNNKSINVSNNNLSGLIGWSGYSNTNIQSINCSSNKITDLDLESIESTLTHLNCSYNLITRLDVPDHVISLDVQFNPLTRLIFNPESDFNQDINNMFKTQDDKPTLTHLFLGNKFNKKINKLPSTLECFFPGENYSHPFGQLLLGCPKLKSLNLGSKFNHEISGLLPESLSYLYFDFESVFNHELSIANLTNLVILEIGEWFNQRLDNLPDSLEEITFSKYSRFNRKLDKLPKKLKYLVLPDKYSRALNNLPTNIKKIFIGTEFNHPIDLFPDSLVEIKFDSHGKFSCPINRIPTSLLVLELPRLYPKNKILCNLNQLICTIN